MNNKVDNTSDEHEKCPYLAVYMGKYTCFSSVLGPKCRECEKKYPRYNEV